MCEDVTTALQKEHDALEWLLAICANTTNATLPVDTDRSIKFENLIIFGWFFSYTSNLYSDLYTITLL